MIIYKNRNFLFCFKGI